MERNVSGMKELWRISVCEKNVRKVKIVCNGMIRYNWHKGHVRLGRLTYTTNKIKYVHFSQCMKHLSERNALTFVCNIAKLWLWVKKIQKDRGRGHKMKRKESKSNINT